MFGAGFSVASGDADDFAFELAANVGGEFAHGAASVFDADQFQAVGRSLTSRHYLDP